MAIARIHQNIWTTNGITQNVGKNVAIRNVRSSATNYANKLQFINKFRMSVYVCVQHIFMCFCVSGFVKITLYMSSAALGLL